MLNAFRSATLISLLLCGGAASAVPCFPGAEGFGADTPGGRGGRVIVVTNLNDSGPGSFREACETKGPRTIVFRVGGYIRLKKRLRVTEPFVTIAGQSAPGSGICLRDAVFAIDTHDVVVRFIRVRVGPSLNEDIDAQNCLEAHGEHCYNVVIDHCSFSWSLDENVGITSGAHDVTFSYNIVSEALRQPFTATKIGKERSHSMGMILGSNPDRCSVHHNLLAHCNSRMPRIQGGTHDFANNVIYDWGFLGATFSRNPQVNFVSNYYKPGPSSQPIKLLVTVDDMGRVYVRGNRVPAHSELVGGEWQALSDADPAAHRSAKPFPTVPLTLTDADRAYRDVLESAGCRLPVFDDVDARVVRQVYLRTGVKIDRPYEVGGYPDLPIAFAPPDSDADGMPDDYELSHGLDPHEAADGSALARGSAYTNLERYLNSLVDRWAAEPAKVAAYPVPDAVRNCPWTVEVNGIRVPVELGGHLDGICYARFQFSRRVRAEVRFDSAAAMELKPEQYADNASSEHGAIGFDVFVPGGRVITAKTDDGSRRTLVLIAEELESGLQTAHGPAVFDVRDFGAVGTGLHTAAIQRALDTCAASRGGGTVYFGPGIYRAGTIRVGDNTTVHLAPGALILGSEDPADYPVDAGRQEQGTHGRVSSFSRLIMFDRCVNSSLTGYGVIDGMGHVIRNKHGRHVQLVDVTGCRGVRIENVVLRNSAEWTLHILASDRVLVRNVKIINDMAVSNTDGIDIDGSTNVRVCRCFAFCGDDAVAIKTTGNSDLLRRARNIDVLDCVLMTRKTALKIGTEIYADISSVAFRDCDVVDSSRGIGVWMRDGACVSDVTFRDIALDLREIEGEQMSGEPVRATIENRNGVGSIRRILFDRVVSRAPYRSYFAGLPESKLEDFDFWGCRYEVTRRTIKKDRAPVLSVSHARNFAFKLAQLRWLADQPELWDGFVGQRDSENVLVRGLEETFGP